MAAHSFQIRVCINPDCRLRYPLTNDIRFGERCPSCLSQTEVVIERPILKSIFPKSIIHPRNTKLFVLLDNIRSALNVGSIFRSSDGFEFTHIYLCGITPTPENGEVQKAAVGAERYIKWSAHNNAVELITDLKNKDNKVWVLEKTKDSIDINKAITFLEKPRNLVLVVGNEITGVDPGILEIADRLVDLPMAGQKSSFNVAVAFAIAAHILCSWDE